MSRNSKDFPDIVTSRSSLGACRFPVDVWYTVDTRGSSSGEHAATENWKGERKAGPNERKNVASTACGMLVLKVAQV